MQYNEHWIISILHEYYSYLPYKGDKIKEGSVSRINKYIIDNCKTARYRNMIQMKYSPIKPIKIPLDEEVFNYDIELCEKKTRIKAHKSR